ncbi:MAG: DUF4143 domain-containing protein [Bacteroidales bacterium]|nr:DUF4143 domain-containing protein [Bacteroidales bacterium]
MENEYRSRIADQLLNECLDSAGAVLVEGPKWCGKTTTALHSAKSVIYLNDPQREVEYKTAIGVDPTMLFEGETPHLIDEWQEAPKLWDVARFLVDRRGKSGQFIFTGSAVPADTSQIKHSGAGRFAWLKMRPMSLYESNESNGLISLKSLFDSNLEPKSGRAPRMSLRDMAFLMCRGGWPGSLDKLAVSSLKVPKHYIDAVASTDISRVDGVKRDASFTKRLLRSYARHQGAQASIATLRKDLLANGQDSISDDTVTSYIEALKKIFVIEDMSAWNPNLRSQTALRTSDTRYFVDPSLATAALGLGPDDLMEDLNTFGLLFETLCVRDLRVYADALDGQVFHYRDKTGLECDAVVHLRNGQYGLVEIKLGGENLINEGIKTLQNLTKKIDTQRMSEPSFRMILTAVGTFAYQRPDDGIWVVPIAALKN